MPNTPVRAAAEGMPKATPRRNFLGLSVGCLALAAAGATVTKAGAAPSVRAKMSSELSAVIQAHKKAHAFWLSVCGCTDSMVLGREASAQEEELWDKGNEGEYAALWDVCRFPARTAADQAAKGRYLRKFHNCKFGYLDEDQVHALILSMIDARKGGAL